MQVLEFILLILSSGLPCVLLALGIFLTYRILDFADLTAEGSFLIGASLTALIIHFGVNPFVATLVGALGGAVCGLITGFLNRILKIPKLLSGIITMTAMTSIAMLIMGLGSSSVFNNRMDVDGNKTIFSLFYPGNEWNTLVEVAVMVIVVVIVIIGLYYFFGTEYGMAIRATGMNEKMAESQGINTTVATIVCVAVSNALIGLGGALYVQDMGAVEITSASGYLVVGLASILIGEAVFGKKSFKNWLISVSLGSVVYFLIITLAQEAGFDTHLMTLLYAILITFALCLPAIKKGILSLFKKKDKDVKEV